MSHVKSAFAASIFRSSVAARTVAASVVARSSMIVASRSASVFVAAVVFCCSRRIRWTASSATFAASSDPSCACDLYVDQGVNDVPRFETM